MNVKQILEYTEEAFHDLHEDSIAKKKKKKKTVSKKDVNC
jgi:hypothetical protein